ncbi:Uncharacterised protein [Escherichia coli]|nr:hypothetical protein G938_01512 [Escherichia coli UMEA 3200-1]ERB17794.1 hypothetical protein G918_02502 [Escherichia coli UMEA 3150-1]OUG29077.1 hypothetical protein AZZ84_004159 [Escherichia coli]CSK98042.1 Uncharacterised protein [Shigella sonnei]CTT96426.1 Uncharacterised protein [Escherichia coli]
MLITGLTIHCLLVCQFPYNNYINQTRCSGFDLFVGVFYKNTAHTQQNTKSITDKKGA